MKKLTNTEFNINDYKDEIDKYIKERVEKEAASEAVKNLKKEVSKRKLSGFIKDVIILLLLLIIAYSAYHLYDEGYFDDKDTIINLKKHNNKEEVKDDNKKDDTKVKDDDKPSLDELITKYESYLNHYNLTSKSINLKDLYNHNLSNSLMLELAFNNIKLDDLDMEDNELYFDSNILTKSFNELFDENIALDTFTYNGIKIKYLDKKDLFYADDVNITENDIVRKITNIVEEDKKVTITCIEGYVNDNKLYNLLSQKEVAKYTEDIDLSKYEAKLNKVSYVFDKGYLIDIK